MLYIVRCISLNLYLHIWIEQGSSGVSVNAPPSSLSDLLDSPPTGSTDNCWSYLFSSAGLVFPILQCWWLHFNYGFVCFFILKKIVQSGIYICWRSLAKKQQFFFHCWHCFSHDFAEGETVIRNIII